VLNSEHDQEMTYDIIAGSMKYPFSWYKSAKMTSLVAIQNNFSHNVPDCYLAPLVCKLWWKNKSKATQQF